MSDTPNPSSSRTESLRAEVGQRLRATAEGVVPWFLSRMPRRYLQDTSDATQFVHLMAILASRAAGMPIRLTLKNEDASEWTFIHEQNHPGLLAELMRQLPRDRPLRSAKIHTTPSEPSGPGLVVDVFRFGPALDRFDASDPAQAAKRERFLAYAARAAADGAGAGTGAADDAGALTVEAFVDACSAKYLRHATPYRLLACYRACRSLFGTSDTTIELDREDLPGTWRISIAAGNADPRDVVERTAIVLGRAGLDIIRAYLDVFVAADRGEVLLVSFVVSRVARAPEHADDQGQGAAAAGPDAETAEASDDPDALGEDTPAWRALRRDLFRLDWLDPRVLSLVEAVPSIGLLRAELLVALASLVHPSLARENAYVYTRDRIAQACVRHADIAVAIVDLYLAAFEPGGWPDAAGAEPGATAGSRSGSRLTDDALDAAIAELVLRIERDVDEPVTRRVLAQLLLSIRATQYTNAYVERRYALAIRFDPSYLNHPERGASPYGAFFVHGRGFSGYHVRFRDIARGGVRVVVPSGREQYALESERLYNEVYDLAFAQQLKNKDIPEGGAKAVILVDPDAAAGMGPGAGARARLIARSVEAFTDSLLDLLSPDPATTARVSNRLGLSERLYLGPDENISPALIEWVVDRAARRGYPKPEAFMSSKPGAGINHKEYGVTSEGVTVFLEEALREIGIDPRAQPFTVKLTGGPDGDVAGNELKILAREFPHTARVVGIADGSGCAEDPAGLDMAELLRLFERALPIERFDRDKLGPGGVLMTVAEPGGIKRRNTMHNRVVSDAFVPAGGRPETINEINWREFLRDGEPASRVIVEGANVFITPAARRGLSQHGVVIVKDSSANKCGVICSSYEIAASMLLTPAEFMAVKDQFVAEVVDKLRELARREARLLFRERRHNPALPLPELSVQVSRVILRATDAIERAMATASDEDRELLGLLVGEHLPPVLTERVRVAGLDSLPPQYLTSMISAALATKVVYREGLAFFGELDDEALARLAIRYLRAERDVAALVAEVESSELPARAEIAELLRRGGPRARLD